MEVMKLIPKLQNYLWGGTKLRTLYDKHSAFETIAESWELSTHKDGECLTCDGKRFSEIITPELLGRHAGKNLGILVKLIDTAANLSVQVHPNDIYAAQFNSLGKREMWYILDHKPGAGIYCGFKRDMTKESLKAALDAGTIFDTLNFFKVNKGDSFFIDAGTVHAIGKGVTICEVQQSSNLTYRLYDYGRTDADGQPRKLHIKEALDVCNLKKYEPYAVPEDLGKGLKRLVQCEEFSVFEVLVNGKKTLTDQDSFLSLTVIEGFGTIEHQDALKGDTFFVPAGHTCTIVGNCTVILAKVEKMSEGA